MNQDGDRQQAGTIREGHTVREGRPLQESQTVRGSQMIREARTYKEALHRASSCIGQAHLQQNNPHIARWLLLHLLQVDDHQLLWKLDQSIPEQHRTQYAQWLDRVLAGEPYQYVIGEEGFFGRTFAVNPSVLIPRPETECLVQEVKGAVFGLSSSPDHKVHGVDVGTGSGVIAISLALECPQLAMTGVDISHQALDTAQYNAKQLQAPVSFMYSDGLQALQQEGTHVQLIVSNPPYIAYADRPHLHATVTAYEPEEALFASDNGLSMYEQIIDQSRQVLFSPGIMAFEVGHKQAEAVTRLIYSRYPQAQCHIKRDLQGAQRIVIAYV